MTTRATVERLTRDAAHAVMTATPNDWPGGFVVIHEPLSNNGLGRCVGDGAGIAGAYGRRDGRWAVLVHVTRCVADMDDPPTALVARLESVVCHEAAHALVGVAASAEVVADVLVAAPTTLASYTSKRVAELHGPTWAAAFWILANRVARYRPRHGTALVDDAARDLARYGFTAGDLEAVTRGVGADVSLRELLAAGGPAGQVLELRLPPVDERATAVAAAGMGVAEPAEVVT